MISKASTRSVRARDIKQNKQIMRIIFILLGLPALIAIFYSTPGDWNKTPEAPGLDTNLIAGYSYFRNHGVEITLESNIELYNTLYPLLGTPHRNRAGRDGLDCSGLVRSVYNEVFNLNIKGGSRDIYRMVQEVAVTDLKEADLIFFKINSTHINHVGIYLGNNKFVHASSSHGVVINDFSESYYQSHFYRAGRLSI